MEKEKNCLFCNSNFEDNSKYHNMKYCSSRCRYRFNRKIRYHKNKDKEREYYLKNKDRIIKYKNNWAKLKWKDDNFFKQKAQFSKYTRRYLKQKVYWKSSMVSKMIGCTPQEFRNHLASLFTSKMSWDNYGSYWEIDHVKDIGSIDTIEEMFKLYHYKNTQPLTLAENRSKRTKKI